MLVDPQQILIETTRANNLAGTLVENMLCAGFWAEPIEGAAPLTVAFTDTTGSAANAWLWDFGDGRTATMTNPTHTYTMTGVYTVSLMVSGPGGNDMLTRANYIAVTETQPVAAFSATPRNGVTPLSVAFTDASTGAITSWEWAFGDEEISTAQHPTHEYTAAGAYSVTLTVTGPGGDDSITKTDYIMVVDPPLVADFTAAPVTGYPPLTVVFTDTSVGVIGKWLWDFGDGVNDTVQHPTHVYPTPGQYTVTLTVTGTGGVDTLVRPAYIHVTEPTTTCVPLTDVAIAGPRETTSTLYIDNLYTFDAVVTPTDATKPITYTWMPAPTTGQGTDSVTYRWSVPDMYTITLTAENCSGLLTVTRAVTIEEKDRLLIYLPLVLRNH